MPLDLDGPTNTTIWRPQYRQDGSMGPQFAQPSNPVLAGLAPVGQSGRLALAITIQGPG